mmetsp:Transcript_93522/g.273845  ORF Transcript_93522/g.273845 Transcript_93522/m.273845 type:complete len:208 (+) Transcript_93522:579-1202(+)
MAGVLMRSGSVAGCSGVLAPCAEYHCSTAPQECQRQPERRRGPLPGGGHPSELARGDGDNGVADVGQAEAVREPPAGVPPALVLAHEPSLWSREEQGRADASCDAAGIEEGHGARVGRQRREGIEDREGQGPGLPPAIIHEASEQGTQQCGGSEPCEEEACNQGSGCRLPVDHLAHVDVVEIWSLQPIRHLEQPEHQQKSLPQLKHL